MCLPIYTTHNVYKSQVCDINTFFILAKTHCLRKPNIWTETNVGFLGSQPSRKNYEIFKVRLDTIKLLEIFGINNYFFKPPVWLSPKNIILRPLLNLIFFRSNN